MEKRMGLEEEREEREEETCWEVNKYRTWDCGTR
jgi:hypothetical protein